MQKNVSCFGGTNPVVLHFVQTKKNSLENQKIMKTVSKILCWSLWLYSFGIQAQNTANQEDNKAEKLEEYRQRAQKLVRFLEYSLNTLGDPETTAQDKDIIINESYLKFFQDDKVQVEDDLDENRDMVTNKDVQAYFKDVDFFFKAAKFEFNIEEITHFTNAENRLFFKVAMSRNLNAVTITGDSVNTNKPRYIEIIVNETQRQLKIVSIYTTKLNEEQELKTWWARLSPDWKKILTGDMQVTDTPSITQLKKILATEELDLSDKTKIRSINPLAKLTKLKKLNISGTQADSIFPIRNLTKLEYLDCSKTKIKTFEPMKYATALTDLYFEGTPVDDISPLQNYTKLQRLRISNTQVKDLQAISQLVGLKELRFSGTKVRSLKSLENLKNLEILQFSETGVNNLSILEKLPNLQVLELDKTAVNDLSPLRQLTQLKSLFINETQVADLSPLNDLKNLSKIYCDHAKVTQSEAKKYMSTHPKTLLIYESGALENWWNALPPTWQTVFQNAVAMKGKPTKEDLHQVSTLAKVDISGQKDIQTLEPLKVMMNLQELNCSGSGISDLMPLADLIDIQTLNLAKTNVDKLELLTNLIKLETLDFSDTKVSRISALMHLSNLKTVYMENTPVAVSEVSKFAGQNNILLIFRTKELQSWWNAVPNEWRAVLTNYVKVDKNMTPEQLHKLTGLTAINITDNSEIQDLSPLRKFIRLKELRFSNTKISDLEPLKDLTTLQLLQCSKSPIRNLTHISGLTNLEHLECENTAIEDLEPLAKLKKMKVLRIAGTPVSNLKDLDKLSEMEEIDISNTNVRFLKPLYELKNLKSLKCYNSKVWQMFVDKFKKSRPKCEVIYY